MIGCASANPPSDVDGGNISIVDARQNQNTIDASTAPDAATSTTPDAAVVSIDAGATGIDAGGGCTTSTQQLLGNPAFDSSGGWTEIPTDEPLIGALPVSPHSAPNGAWLGFYNYAEDVLYQDIDIPAGANSVLLSGQYWIQTDESFGQWDYLDLSIFDKSSGAALTGALWTNLDADDHWQPFSFPIENAAGTTVRIELYATTDDSYPTDFFFDSFSLTASVCQ